MVYTRTHLRVDMYTLMKFLNFFAYIFLTNFSLENYIVALKIDTGLCIFNGAHTFLMMI